MPVYGQLPSIVFEYFTEQSAVNRIGVLTVDIAFNGRNSRVTAVLSVEQFPPLGSWLTSVTATPRNELAAVGMYCAYVKQSSIFYFDGCVPSQC